MKYLVQIFFVFMFSNAFGQGITFKNINTNVGLYSNLVYNACQGPDDLLWIIANHRLDCYNEGKVTNFDNGIVPGIEDHKLAEILIDSSNIIWLRSMDKDLLYLDQNRNLVKVDLENRLTRGILNLINTDKGNVEFLAREGHFSYNVEDQTLDTLHLFEEPIFKFPALQISLEKGGKYVFNAGGKAILYNSNSGKVEYVFDQVSTHGAVLLSEDLMIVSTNRHHELFLVDIRQDKVLRNLAHDVLKQFPETNTYYRRVKHLDDTHIGITSGHQGLFVMNVNDYSFENFAHDFANPSSISSDNSYFLYTGNGGNVFVTSRTSGLNIFNRDRTNARHIKSFVDQHDNSIFEGHISHLGRDSEGTYWLASSQGLLRYSAETGKMRRDFRQQVDDEILSIISLYIDDRDRLFLGASGGGLEVLDTEGNELASFSNRKGKYSLLKSDYVYCYMIGPDERLWIGTSRGINILDMETLELIKEEPEFFANELNTRIRELRKIGEEYFIGTWNKGGFVLANGELKKIDIPDSFDIRNVTDFGKDETDGLYVGSQKGLFYLDYNKDERQYEFHKKVLDGRILSIDKDRSGNNWVAVENILYKYSANGKKIESFTNENGFTGGGFRMHGSYVDKEGRFYYGLNTGLCHFDPEDLGKNEIELNPYITGVFRDDHKMLISRDARIELQSDENNIGVYYDNIDIWNSPSVRYQYSITQKDDEWIDAITNPILIQNIGSGDYTVKLRASIDGKEWVQSSNVLHIYVAFPWWRSWWFYGFVLFGLTAMSYVALSFYIRLKKDKEEERKYDENLKLFSFSMHKYADMEKEFWDVVLKSIRQLNIDASAIYMKGDEGEYFYRQAARIESEEDKDFLERSDLMSSDNELVSKVLESRQPAIFGDLASQNGSVLSASRRNSKIFVPIISNDEVLGIIDCEHQTKNYFNDKRYSFLSAIATIVATKMAAYYAEEERKEAEISLSNNLKKVSELEMKSLRSQMNPHFMFNSLNSINNFIVKNDQENASDYLTSFAQLMRIILENSRQDWVSLESELKALRLYIGMEKLRFENLFFYHESISSDINMMTTLVPPMLIQPYIENAIWHGLLPKKSSQCNLKLEVSKEDDYLKIVVDDDGIGTRDSKKRKSSFNISKKSFGQKIISERLDMINKIYDLDAKVNIVDKSDLSGSETGTRVTLSMKLKKATV